MNGPLGPSSGAPEEARAVLSDADVARVASAVVAALREDGTLPLRNAAGGTRRKTRRPEGRRRRRSSVLQADVLLAGIALIIVTVILLAWAV